MRQPFIILGIFFLLISTPGAGQSPYGNQLASANYKDVKYSLVMADHVQLAYDGTSMKGKIAGYVFDLGDKRFYRGHYLNASASYKMGFTMMPAKKQTGFKDMFNDFNVFNKAMSVNVNALDFEGVRIYAGGLNLLGIFYHSLGRYKKAEELLTLSMEIRADQMGKTSPAFINSLENIANLKKDLGEYDEAEYIYNYLDRVLAKKYTKSSYHYVIFLNNKAMLYATLGRRKEALNLLSEAIELGEKYLDPAYIDLERLMINKGFLLIGNGEIAEAENLLIAAEQGIVNKGFAKHPDHNSVLIYLGRIYLETGDPRAQEFIQKSTENAKKEFGKDHLLYAKALENEVLYYMKVNNYAKALEKLSLISEIRFNALGSKNLDYIGTTVLRATCEWELNNVSSANAYFKDAMENYTHIIDNLFTSFSEVEKGEFWAQIKPNIEIYLSFAASVQEESTDIIKDALTLHINTKGILLNSITKTKDNILASADSTLIASYQEWATVKDQLAYYYSVPMIQAKEDKVDLPELEKKANALEKAITRKSAKFANDLSQLKSSYESISSSLSSDEAAIEIVRVLPNIGPNRDKVQYLAFIIKSNGLKPELVVLENGEALESKQLLYYRNAIKFKIDDEKSYAEYWAPLETKVAGINHLYMSMDGVYNTLNIKSLRTPDGQYLIDLRDWTIVSNSRDIAKLKARTGTEMTGNTATLIGDPNFGNEDKISQLPGTEIEISKISALLAANGFSNTVFTKNMASEENLKAVNSPGVLHLATHGFFLSDVSKDEGMVMGILVEKAKANPLLRSGLMLADAGSVYDEKPIYSTKSNGIINAYEAMSLNLEGTNLVVLSACETGMGEIVNGEGVYGLPRAIQVAGASNILMSLWKVDDTATQELMEDFYARWTKGESLDKSLQGAQLAIKEKYKHPYYWGAFVLMEN